MGGYWEGSGLFPPVGQTIEWFVDADENGPAESQRAVFQAIVDRYSELEPLVRAVLAKEVAAWVGTEPYPQLTEVLKLTSLSVPTSETAEMHWELSFDSTLRGTPHFAVAMKGWAPTGEVEVST